MKDGEYAGVTETKSLNSEFMMYGIVGDIKNLKLWLVFYLNYF